MTTQDHPPTTATAKAPVAGIDRPRARTQSERTRATRQALLDATITCLVESGYAATTTAAVCARAGLSRGAHLHHFKTRQQLLAAAVHHLATVRLQELRAAADALPATADPVQRGLDLVWASFANPTWQAALDLWSASRSDPELRTHLLDVEHHLDVQTLQIASLLFPVAAHDNDFPRLVELIVATVRGLALLDTLHPGSQRNARQWPFARQRLADLLRAPQA